MFFTVVSGILVSLILGWIFIIKRNHTFNEMPLTTDNHQRNLNTLLAMSIISRKTKLKRQETFL
ncbi:MAG: hypothetical protein H6Q67_282 [Firmicutes bacterium]|nr:hypothetical protein [Bacillota bacterium]